MNTLVLRDDLGKLEWKLRLPKIKIKWGKPKIRISKKDLKKALKVAAIVGGAAVTVATGGMLAPAVTGGLIAAGKKLLKQKAGEEIKRTLRRALQSKKPKSFPKESIIPGGTQAIQPQEQKNILPWIAAGIVLLILAFILITRGKK
jgi:hypothetical protein